MKITPLNSDGFLSFTFDNYNIFQSNLNKFNKADSLNTAPNLFDNVIEAGIIYQAKNHAVVLNSLDENFTLENLLNESTALDTYRQVDIYQFSKPLLFNELFSPLIPEGEVSNFCVLDNFFVFSNDIDLLQNIITNYQNKTTLSQQSYYTDIKAELSDASSLLLVLNPSLLNEVLNNNLNSEVKNHRKLQRICITICFR